MKDLRIEMVMPSVIYSFFCFPNRLRPSIFSDVFVMQPELTINAASQCSLWLSSQANLPRLDPNGQAQCPCTLKQAAGDTAQFSPDPFCMRGSNSPMNCRYRPSQAQECILPNHVRCVFVMHYHQSVCLYGMLEYHTIFYLVNTLKIVRIAYVYLE